MFNDTAIKINTESRDIRKIFFDNEDEPRKLLLNILKNNSGISSFKLLMIIVKKHPALLLYLAAIDFSRLDKMSSADQIKKADFDKQKEFVRELLKDLPESLKKEFIKNFTTEEKKFNQFLEWLKL
jgi:hypothetical protein